MRAKLLALLAGTAIAVTATTPAHATTWSGNGFEFGLGEYWDFSNFSMGDVRLGSTAVEFADNEDEESGLYTDIWDGGLDIEVTSPTAGVDGGSYECSSDSDIEITVGDNVDLQCTTDWADVTNEDVSIRGAIRIYGPDGDLVRMALAITNNSDEDITDFVVDTHTDWGTDGDIWDYQNYDEAVLAVPATEGNDNSAAIEETGSDWISTYSDGDAPGSLAWGSDAGSVDVALTETSSDEFYTESEEFTVRAGETAYLVYFLGWDPANLVEIAYGDNDFTDEGDDILAADAVADAATEFNEFSGRLNDGLEDANVLNWGPDPGPALADTGVDASGIALGGALVLAAGVAVAIRRRARA